MSGLRVLLVALVAAAVLAACSSGADDSTSAREAQASPSPTSVSGAKTIRIEWGTGADGSVEWAYELALPPSVEPGRLSQEGKDVLRFDEFLTKVDGFSSSDEESNGWIDPGRDYSDVKAFVVYPETTASCDGFGDELLGGYCFVHAEGRRRDDFHNPSEGDVLEADLESHGLPAGLLPSNQVYVMLALREPPDSPADANAAFAADTNASDYRDTCAKVISEIDGDSAPEELLAAFNDTKCTSKSDPTEWASQFQVELTALRSAYGEIADAPVSVFFESDNQSLVRALSAFEAALTAAGEPPSGMASTVATLKESLAAQIASAEAVIGALENDDLSTATDAYEALVAQVGQIKSDLDALTS